MSHKNRKWISKKDDTWKQIFTIVFSNLGIMLTFFLVTISLHLSSRDEIRAIQAEIKDFHGKICTIEAQKRGKYE